MARKRSIPANQTGEKTKGSGRKAGQPNKTTKEMKEMINTVMSHFLPQLHDDLESLSPKDRINALKGLLDFVLPKKSEQIIPEGMYTLTFNMLPVQSKPIELDGHFDDAVVVEPDEKNNDE